MWRISDVRHGRRLRLLGPLWCVFVIACLSSLLGSRVCAEQYEVQLAWVDNATNEDGFKVERKLETAGSYAVLATVGPNTETYADAAVDSGATYCYRVKAFNAAGESGYTNEVCAMPSVVTASSPPPSSTGSTSGTTQSTVTGSVSTPASVQTASAVVTAGDAGGGGGGGCFIATAAFGSPLAPQVQLLREVRDKYLVPYQFGRVAVQAYYAVSPPIADVISRSETLRAAVRFGLMPVLGWSALALWSPGLSVGIPLLPVFAGAWLIRRRSRQR